MTSRKTRPGCRRSGRAQNSSPSIMIENEAGSVKRPFDRILSCKLDCIQYLIEHEADEDLCSGLIAYRSHLEQGVPDAH